ncbi:hypothetical protein CONLIGDRAFT_631570 [Coniochaeta ligniaria NRRL 30616]|uniref:Uncharacterized protein n=1 Tax=Coniochaeta ligniaria NRRL 30616 TaxID=1408157 RepID=A0A1J7IQL2_9PEZI|nr:hypothetical protein CONLIGDRAFT_631570 [Coniochaeta ligniaria NRRL 30616]
MHRRRHERSKLAIPSHPRCGHRPSSGQAALPTGSLALHLPVPLTTPVQSDHIETYLYTTLPTLASENIFDIS